ncbi:MAG: M2 family metallopeptidase [Ignavibacteria bacterium]|nr:M2 family metallopeptidase [Ignavibacteria bacterium]
MKNKFFPLLLLTTAIFLSLLIFSCSSKKNEQMNNEFKEFVKNWEINYIPLFKELNITYWDASISGKKEDFDKVLELQNKITTLLSNKESFDKLKRFKESGAIKDELDKRQLEVLYLLFLSNQVDTSLLNAVNKLQNEIEQKYTNFRAEVNGKQLTDNEIEEVLSTSTNSLDLQTVWEAHKKIGTIVADDIKQLVKMRNEIARKLGFNNFHEMSLKLKEQDPNDILKLFDELDALTKDAFAKEKENIDDYFTKRYKIPKDKLMPWHYQNRFFQEAPKIYEVDLDIYYKDKDLVKLTAEYYAGIGLPVDDIIANSDLYEKPGKNQHAYCIDIDNEGDVRVLCNIKPNEKWMNTMLHEYGHAVYDKFIDRQLPFSLREPAHTFTTEAIAQLFGRMATNANWIKDMVGISDEKYNEIKDNCYKSLRLHQLVFSRWSQVMYRFEKSMYENPDQDLNKLWWDLVERYQMIKKPEGRNQPDWASKIHIATVPCYYHNYLLGEILASQLQNYIVSNILKSNDLINQSFKNNAEVGKYLREKIFAPGLKFFWNDMIEKATGEKLTPKYYAKMFIN